MIHKTRAVISGLRKKNCSSENGQVQGPERKNNHCPKITRGDEIFAQYIITN